MVNEFYNFLGETIPSTTDMSNLRKDPTHKRKLDCLEGSSNMGHPIRRCIIGANKVNNSLGWVTKKLEVAQSSVRSSVRLGYKVKNRNAEILKAIFIKYGDMAAECVCKTASLRSSLLKVVCKVVRRIQTSDVTTILSEFKEIEAQVLDAEATNINVSWLLAHMEAIQKRNEAMKKYYQEVVTFFDLRNKKHKLLYDDGDEALLHLEREQWDCLEPEVSINVSSPQSGITCVQGYKVTNINAPILEAIFKKYGDIASDCVFKKAFVTESILEVVCDVKKIQTNDAKTIISEMEELDSQLSGAEANKINVSWLRAHLESVHKRNEALKKCVKVLHLVEQKLNDDIFESKAEENKWVMEQDMPKKAYVSSIWHSKRPRLQGDIAEIENLVSAAEANKINASWLRAHLKSIHKRNNAKKNCSLLMKTRANTGLVTRAAIMDLKSAKERFEKAERCVKVLDLVEKKLHDNFLESKAEKDFWAKQPVLLAT
ncbi:phospholipase-like protein [Tanacetum coccineum]|uniref:Phospholipase-like protein n=1 Tax=Tanacetum coccineum TaxID=301880 RepID=A0ABQ5GFX8_9ASTR